MRDLKGTYYYFKDLVDEHSFNYGKFTIIKAINSNEAWNKLKEFHIEEYKEYNKTIESLYELSEIREIN